MVKNYPQKREIGQFSMDKDTLLQTFPTAQVASKRLGVRYEEVKGLLWTGACYHGYRLRYVDGAKT